MNHKIALLVAEKPSVAKAVAQFLSKKAKKSMKQVKGASMYNPIYEFEYPGKQSNLTSNKAYKFRVTSVSGHIMGKKFPESMKIWDSD